MSKKSKIILFTIIIEFVMVFSAFNVQPIAAQSTTPQHCSILAGDVIAQKFILVATDSGYNSTSGFVIHVNPAECFTVTIVNQKTTTDNFTVDEIGGGRNDTLDAPTTGIDAVLISTPANSTSDSFSIRAPNANMKVEFYSAGLKSSQYGYFIVGNVSAPGFDVVPLFIALSTSAIIVTIYKKKKLNR